MTDLHRPHGSARDGEDPVHLTPEDAGWSYTGLRVLSLRVGEVRMIDTGEFELFVLPLEGGCRVEVGDDVFTLTGRGSVFTHVSDFAYVGRDATMRLSSPAPATIALPMARSRRALPARYVPADAVPVEVRGAGVASRQVTNFGVPGPFDGADRLMACEVLTPAGNWSSYPPHRHDHTCPIANEEIYYFRIAGPDDTSPGRTGFGLHRTYDDTLDLTVEVRDGDVCLVPHGYHGPSAAPPGYEMYYLNVLAGPGPERSMAFCDDPAHAWVRDSWMAMEPDPRCPLTSASGRTERGERCG